MNAEAALVYAWDQQSIWSQAANGLKRSVVWRRHATLGLNLAGAVLSAAAASVSLSGAPGKVLAFAAAVALGVGGLIQTSIKQRTVRDWTRTRSISEALKATVYLHCAGFGRRDLDAELAELERESEDLRQYCVGLEAKPRGLPAVTDISTYLTVRVRGQIDDYYRSRARDLRSKLRWAQRTEYGLAIAGVLAAAAAGTWEVNKLAAWVPVITTVAAAVTTHVAAQRWSYSLIEYTRTAAELDLIQARLGSAAALSDRQLAERAEEIISIQNDAWMVKHTQPDDE
jgi:hypothetical protein